MKRFLILASAMAFFPVIVAIDSWFFRTLLGQSYVDWYIANGAFISIVASLFAVIWRDVNKNADLISADPRLFLSANLILIGPQFQIIGHQLQETGTKFRAQWPLEAARQGSAPISDLLDGVAGFVAAIFMVSALTVWFLAIVPLQYFVVLVAGAPARLALKLRAQVTSPSSAPENAPTNPNELREWQSNVLAAPVSMTNAVAALLILALKLAQSGAA